MFKRVFKILTVICLCAAAVFAAAGCDIGQKTYCTVTFDSLGGSKVPSQKIVSGGTAEKPQDPEKQDFIFDGWFTDTDCTEEYSFSNKVTKSFTLYAKWKQDELPVEPPEDIFFTVTFDANGHGVAPDPQTIKQGLTATQPAPLSEDGFTFGGWYKDSACTDEFDFSTPITADITLYAKWVEDTSETYFTVWFDSRGGNEIYARRVVSGSAVAPPADPVREGFTFAGWYSAEGEEFDFSKPVNSDLTLYAKWVEDTSETYFTVEFDSRGGNAVYAQEVISGGKAVKPADPVREGFTFTGWFTDEETKNAYDFNTTIDGDIKLYAGWIEN